MTVYRRAVPVLLGFLCGLGGEGLLLLQRHCRAIEGELLSDFRLVAFLSSPVEGKLRQSIEDSLQALEGVESVSYVGAGEAIGRLAKAKPELAGVKLREDILPGAVEIRVKPQILGHLGDWVLKAEEVKGVEQVRYKPLEANALLQVRFYSRFMDVVLGLAWFATAAAAAVLAGRRLKRGEGRWNASAETAAAGGLGALIGLFLCLVLAFPVRHFIPLWVLPAFWGQLGVAVTGALLGWVAAEA